MESAPSTTAGLMHAELRSLDLVGAGPEAVVFARADDALKVLRRMNLAPARVTRHAVRIAALQALRYEPTLHVPNGLAWTDEGRVAIAAPRAEQSLYSLVAEGAASVGDIECALRAAHRALACLHGIGMVHGNVHAANVLRLHHPTRWALADIGTAVDLALTGSFLATYRRHAYRVTALSVENDQAAMRAMCDRLV